MRLTVPGITDSDIELFLGFQDVPVHFQNLYPNDDGEQQAPKAHQAPQATSNLIRTPRPSLTARDIKMLRLLKRHKGKGAAAKAIPGSTDQGSETSPAAPLGQDTHLTASYTTTPSVSQGSNSGVLSSAVTSNLTVSLNARPSGAMEIADDEEKRVRIETEATEQGLRIQVSFFKNQRENLLRKLNFAQHSFLLKGQGVYEVKDLEEKYEELKKQYAELSHELKEVKKDTKKGSDQVDKLERRCAMLLVEVNRHRDALDEQREFSRKSDKEKADEIARLKIELKTALQNATDFEKALEEAKEARAKLEKRDPRMLVSDAFDEDLRFSAFISGGSDSIVRYDRQHGTGGENVGAGE